MTNYLSLNVGLLGNINGISINANNNTQTTPTGSIALEYSTLVNTGAFQQIFTGSAGQTIGTIAFFSSNTSGTGSVTLSTASAGTPVMAVIPAGGTFVNPNWNSTLNALYATATTTASYGVFYVLSN
jgi:hypothetical protein